ncbi:MAG: hypothetical protein KBE22_08080 [Candidatus Accumulibacter sp.]|uniref:Uncharacterized protein n=1 Tax=Candidatus Accumulibacter affinis TaxID=2954384 RepID=A0A935T9M1_9PROT|nr:hypothetical protein [Candidatus Accumulibacter affinis]MBP9804845.1 hypothetical protein [Accumulibacter sp.]
MAIGGAADQFTEKVCVSHFSACAIESAQANLNGKTLPDCEIIPLPAENTAAGASPASGLHVIICGFAENLPVDRRPAVWLVLPVMRVCVGWPRQQSSFRHDLKQGMKLVRQGIVVAGLPSLS